MLFANKERSKIASGYILPDLNEITAVFQSDVGMPAFERDLRVYPKVLTDHNFITSISGDFERLYFLWDENENETD